MQILYWLNTSLITTLNALKTTSQSYTPNWSLLPTYSIHLTLDRSPNYLSGIDRCLKTCMTADSASAITRTRMYYTIPKQKNSYSLMLKVSESGTRVAARYTRIIYLACTGMIHIYTTTCISWARCTRSLEYKRQWIRNWTYLLRRFTVIWPKNIA